MNDPVNYNGVGYKLSLLKPEIDLVPESDTLLIVFRETTVATYRRAYERYNCNKIFLYAFYWNTRYIISKWKYLYATNRFRNSGFEHYHKYLQKLIDRIKPKRVVLAGVCGGGWASILFGTLLKADSVVATIPQTFIMKNYPPELIQYYIRTTMRYCRFSKENSMYLGYPGQSDILDLKQLFNTSENSKTVHYLYTSNSSIDKLAVAHLRDYENTKCYLLPDYSCHFFIRRSYLDHSDRHFTRGEYYYYIHTIMDKVIPASDILPFDKNIYEPVKIIDFPQN